MISLLPPLPVAGPLAVASLLLVLGPLLPPKMPDITAVLTALATAFICSILAAYTAQGPLIYWFGGWTPHAGQQLGIDFTIDQSGAALSAFIGVLFAATMVFAWGYFDEVHGHFHVLMLLFMAGMIGFCLTHDLFNMFVWFEVMSVAAFALTGYQLRSSALEGALNFTVLNTLGSYLFLGGIGLIYARVGALDFSALARGIAQHPQDPVVAAAFALLATGLLIKAAQVPFQFWLSDAHAVAPSPVSVIFSGAMVALGLYGVAKLGWTAFSPAADVVRVIRTLLLGLGVATAIVGGIVALLQRHVKRLLAFSTISHMGIMLIGLAVMSQGGLSGMFLYLIGHGLVKAALFMVAGILLAMRGSIDEIGLIGLGRDIAPAGVAMAVGGLLLAGLPLGVMDEGSTMIAAAGAARGGLWLVAAIVFGSACTGAAVLRVAGRVFLGLGPVPGQEERAPTAEEQEKANRPLWLMLAPAALLLLLALPNPDAVRDFAWHAAAQFMLPVSGAAPALLDRPGPATPTIASLGGFWVALSPWISVLLALALAAFALMRHRLPRLAHGSDRALGPLLNLLQRLHSGRVGDYVAWMAAGVALFALAFALV